MGFNSAFKGLKLLKNPGNGRLNNLNDPILNVLSECVRFYVLRILFVSNSEIYAASTTIDVVPFSKTGRKGKTVKKNIENIQRSM